MFTYRSECVFVMIQVGPVALMILCETTSLSTNIYTSLYTSRCKIFLYFYISYAAYYRRREMTLQTPSEQAARGASVNARMIINV
jgi:hypothetical protein